MNFWLDKNKWSHQLNTFICLVGCSIGDFGTDFVFSIIYEYKLGYAYNANRNI